MRCRSIYPHNHEVFASLHARAALACNAHLRASLRRDAAAVAVSRDCVLFEDGASGKRSTVSARAAHEGFHVCRRSAPWSLSSETWQGRALPITFSDHCKIRRTVKLLLASSLPSVGGWEVVVAGRCSAGHFVERSLEVIISNSNPGFDVRQASDVVLRRAMRSLHRCNNFVIDNKPLKNFTAGRTVRVKAVEEGRFHILHLRVVPFDAMLPMAYMQSCPPRVRTAVLKSLRQGGIKLNEDHCLVETASGIPVGSTKSRFLLQQHSGGLRNPQTGDWEVKSPS